MKKIFYFVYIAGFILSLISCSTEMGIKSEELSVTLERDTFYCGEKFIILNSDDYFRVTVKDTNDKEIVLKYGDYFLKGIYPQDITCVLAHNEGGGQVFTSDKPQIVDVILVYTVRSSGTEGAYFNEGKMLLSKTLKIRFINPDPTSIDRINIVPDKMNRFVFKKSPDSTNPVTAAKAAHFFADLKVTLNNDESFVLDYLSKNWSVVCDNTPDMTQTSTPGTYTYKAKYYSKFTNIGNIYLIDNN